MYVGEFAAAATEAEDERGMPTEERLGVVMAHVELCAFIFVFECGLGR